MGKGAGRSERLRDGRAARSSTKGDLMMNATLDLVNRILRIVRLIDDLPDEVLDVVAEGLLDDVQEEVKPDETERG